MRCNPRCCYLLRIGIPAAMLLACVRVTLAQTNVERDLIFSHRTHLELTDIDCLTCHSSVASSTSSGTNALPSEETCLGCHDGLRAANRCEVCHRNPKSVRPVSIPERTYRFNHKLHLSLGNIAPA